MDNSITSQSTPNKSNIHFGSCNRSFINLKYNKKTNCLREQVLWDFLLLCLPKLNSKLTWQEYPVTYSPSLNKHLPWCFKNQNTIISRLWLYTNWNITVTQMHTYFTYLYIAGNFPCLTNVPSISGGEWAPTCPSHHLSLWTSFKISLPPVFNLGQSQQSLTKCNVFVTL